MLINCKPGCSGSKHKIKPNKTGTTNANLNVELNEVICDLCGDSIEVSSFTKNSMKQRGEITKPAKKSFQFDCLTCKSKVQTTVNNNKLIGTNCKKDCKFNVSPFTIFGMKTISNKIQDDDDEE